MKLYHCTDEESAESILNEGFNNNYAYFCPDLRLYSEVSFEGGNSIIEYEYDPKTNKHTEQSNYVVENPGEVRKKVSKIINGDYIPQADDKFEVVIWADSINPSDLKLIQK